MFKYLFSIFLCKDCLWFVKQENACIKLLIRQYNKEHKEKNKNVQKEKTEQGG